MILLVLLQPDKAGDKGMDSLLVFGMLLPASQSFGSLDTNKIGEKTLLFGATPSVLKCSTLQGRRFFSAYASCSIDTVMHKCTCACMHLLEHAISLTLG